MEMRREMAGMRVALERLGGAGDAGEEGGQTG